MENKKIIQICPCAPNLWVEYVAKNNQSIRVPIVCLALVEDECGNREVRFVDANGPLDINLVGDSEEFVASKIVYGYDL